MKNLDRKKIIATFISRYTIDQGERFEYYLNGNREANIQPNVTIYDVLHYSWDQGNYFNYCGLGAVELNRDTYRALVMNRTIRITSEVIEFLQLGIDIKGSPFNHIAMDAKCNVSELRIAVIK